MNNHFKHISKVYKKDYPIGPDNHDYYVSYLDNSGTRRFAVFDTKIQAIDFINSLISIEHVRLYFRSFQQIALK